MPTTLHPTSKTQLRTLVEQAIGTHGPGVDLNHIDVSAIDDFSYIFFNTTFCGSVSSWNLSRAKTVGHMFELTTVNTDLSMWDMSNVEDFSAMFERATGEVGPIAQWCVGQARNMSAMFAHARLDARQGHWACNPKDWDVSKVTNFARMFECHGRNPDLSRWNVSCGTLFSGMFEGSAFNGDVSQWNVSAGRSFFAMFKNSYFEGDGVNAWNVENATNLAHMFATPCFRGDVSRWSIRCDALENFMLPESLAATKPSVYHWRWAMNATPGARTKYIPQKARRQFLAAHLPAMEHLQLTGLPAAQMLHHAWQQRRKKVNAFMNTLPLPLLDGI